MSDPTDDAEKTLAPEDLTSEAVEAELNETRRRSRNATIVRNAVYALLAAAAIAVLVASFVLPVMRIYGTSMTPTTSEGDIVVAAKGSSFEQGDIVALYYNNKLLVKRVIAGPGSWVDIMDDGTVLVDGVIIDEPYLTESSFEPCDITLPYQVPEDSYFVMGDHRSTSIDSRSSELGCVSTEDIVGRIVFRIWPLSGLGTIS